MIFVYNHEDPKHSVVKRITIDGIRKGFPNFKVYVEHLLKSRAEKVKNIICIFETNLLYCNIDELNKIIKKNPLEVADDDHLNRPDISKEEFSDAIDQLKKKYNQDEPKSKEDIEHSRLMLEGTLAAMNNRK